MTWGPNGEVHVDFKRSEVADSVSAIVNFAEHREEISLQYSFRFVAYVHESPFLEWGVSHFLGLRGGSLRIKLVFLYNSHLLY